jgi:hypothetical protein
MGTVKARFNSRFLLAINSRVLLRNDQCIALVPEPPAAYLENSQATILTLHER